MNHLIPVWSIILLTNNVIISTQFLNLKVTSGTSTIEDEDSETSVTMSEDADESHQSEESEDAQLERWYTENGMFNSMEDMEENFIERLQEI